MAALNVGIALHVGARRPRPGAAEAAHAGAHIKEERLALLLAVVADVDAGVALSAHDRFQCGAAGFGELRIDRFATLLRR